MQLPPPGLAAPPVLPGVSPAAALVCLPCSVHEVHIDDKQLDFLRDTLQRAGSRPVLMFTHAPPMGSGLKVLPVSPGRAALWHHVHMSGSPGQAPSLLPGVMHAPHMVSWVGVLQANPGRAGQSCVAVQRCPVPGPHMHHSWQVLLVSLNWALVGFCHAAGMSCGNLD